MASLPIKLTSDQPLPEVFNRQIFSIEPHQPVDQPAGPNRNTTFELDDPIAFMKPVTDHTSIYSIAIPADRVQDFMDAPKLSSTSCLLNINTTNAQGEEIDSQYFRANVQKLM